VQALPSSQSTVLAAKTQPLVGSQLSSVHGLLSLQLALGPGWHTPPWQVSGPLQALPSLHGPAWGKCAQPLSLSHESALQGLASSQSILAPGWQLEPLQVSPWVHTSPSLQLALAGRWTQPFSAMQLSAVHALASSQSTASPKHAPNWHWSAVEQALPSSQLAVTSW
jgi:hypothetical protein